MSGEIGLDLTHYLKLEGNEVPLEGVLAESVSSLAFANALDGIISKKAFAATSIG